MINPHLSVRAAAFKTAKRTIAADQTIEPTQVAGFNQIFNDIDGAVFKRYGVGLDMRFTDKLFGGVELSRRDLEIPIGGAPGPFELEQDQENLYRAYLYWLLHREWAVSAEYIYEGFKVTEGQLRTFFSGIPTQLDTTRIPLTVHYFNPTGFFASLGAMYVHQDIQNLRPNFSDMTATESADSENFVLVDAGLGYRLPKRLGLFSLEINNVLDKTFRFQDYGFNTTESTPPFVPERTLFARFVVNL